MTTSTMTITEALSEVNLISKKIDSKKPVILMNAIRNEHLPDPYEKEGGSSEMVKREWQSLSDLSRRLEKVRAAISQANLANTIRIDETEKTIHDWLVWKRETQKWSQEFISQVLNQVKQNQGQFERAPQVFKDQDGTVKLLKLTVNVDIPEWQRRLENNVELTEKLDGQLSLKNATITVTI